MIRVLHFSDVHVPVPWGALPWRQMANKRLLGAANQWLRRRKRFARAREKLTALAEFARARRVDVGICTGDYTVLGTEPELCAARAAVEALVRMPLGFVTVPGNHDVYLRDSVRDARFERAFGDLLANDWPEYAVDSRWPLVRLFGESLAVVAVESARPNPEPWRSSGRVPEAQLRALSRVLVDPRMAERIVLVVTHYAARRRDGTPDRRFHGMENADALVDACGAHPRAALLHGHIHWRYHLGLAGMPPMFGAGSATDAGREGAWLFEVEPGALRAVPLSWGEVGWSADEGREVLPWG